MDASTVTSKGQVTIPKEVRRALGIRQGSRVAFVAKDGRCELRVVHHVPESIVSGYGMLDARGKHLAADFDPASLLAPVGQSASKGARKTVRGSQSAGKR